MVNLFAWKNHNHDASDIITGSIDPLRNPALPRGMVFYAVGAAFGQTNIPTTGVGLGEVAFTPQVGRQYEITWHPSQVWPPSTGQASVIVDIGYTTDGTRPLLTSAKLRRQQVVLPGPAVFTTPPDIVQPFSVSSAPANPWRFLGMMSLNNSTTTYTRADITDYASQWWKIMDLGPTATVNGITANTG